MNNLIGISVIICCYNSGDKLIPTLKHLAVQKMLPGITLEIIIVDNKCTDNSIKIAMETWESLSQPFSLSIVQELKPGLSFARVKGMQMAKFDLAVFCDDDNWLCNDYLLRISALFEKMPQVAIIGGVGEAVSENILPVWFNAVDGFGYAVGTEGRTTGYVDSVYGAGMALRRKEFNSIISDANFILTDRKGNRLSSGGDMEICILMKNAGYKIYLDESLTFKHFLPQSRLSWNYYLKLRRAFGKANGALQINNGTFLKKKKMMEYLSMGKFVLMHFHFFLFPNLFKEPACARFAQELGRRIENVTVMDRLNQSPS